MRKFMNGHFFRVSNHIFDYKLSPYSFMVYCFLQKCDNKERGCFPSKATIAKSCGISKTSVDAAIKDLVKRGIIRVDRRYENGHQQTNLYTLCDLDLLWENELDYEGIEKEAQQEERELLPF